MFHHRLFICLVSFVLALPSQFALCQEWMSATYLDFSASRMANAFGAQTKGTVTVFRSGNISIAHVDLSVKPDFMSPPKIISGAVTTWSHGAHRMSDINLSVRHPYSPFAERISGAINSWSSNSYRHSDVDLAIWYPPSPPKRVSGTINSWSSGNMRWGEFDLSLHDPFSFPPQKLSGHFNMWSSGNIGYATIAPRTQTMSCLRTRWAISQW